eukprot:646639-Pelagomonas_calceolata.AAC.1
MVSEAGVHATALASRIPLCTSTAWVEVKLALTWCSTWAAAARACRCRPGKRCGRSNDAQHVCAAAGLAKDAAAAAAVVAQPHQRAKGLVAATTRGGHTVRQPLRRQQLHELAHGGGCGGSGSSGGQAVAAACVSSHACREGRCVILNWCAAATVAVAAVPGARPLLPTTYSVMPVRCGYMINYCNRAAGPRPLAPPATRPCMGWRPAAPHLALPPLVLRYEMPPSLLHHSLDGASTAPHLGPP